MMNNYFNQLRKTLCLLLLIGGGALPSFAQMYFRETFEAQFTPNTALGPNAPSGWTQTRQGTTSVPPTGSTTSGAKDWAWMSWTGSAWNSNTLPNVNYAGNGTTPPAPFEGNGVLWFNDAFTSTPAQNLRRLESPVIDLSGAIAPVIKITYWYVSGGANTKVQGSVNGSSWTDLQTLTTTGSNWVTYTITIPAGLRVATFQLGLQVSNAFQAQGVWLDDVSIFDYPASFTSTPAGGNWSNPSAWVDGVAPVLNKGTENIIINNNSAVTMDIASTIGSLTLNANATLSLNENLIGTGALTVNSGSVLNAHNGSTGKSITLSGSFVNGGMIDMSKQGAALILNGTAVQDISGTFVNNSIPSLTLNNPAGVTLNTNIKVPVALNLNKAVLSGTGMLTLGDATFSSSFTMTSTGGSVSCPVSSGLTGVETVTYNYNPSVPAGSYTTGNELMVSAPNLNLAFAAMAGGNYILGTDVTANNILFNDTVVVNASQALTVNGASAFTASTMVTGAGSFWMGPNATLSTNHIAGITAFSATGSVQTSSRNYSATGNYIYGGATGQETGDGLPPFLTGGTVTANTNPLSLTQTTIFNNLVLNVNLVTAAGKDITINATGNLGTFAITGAGNFTAGPASRLLLNSTHANGVLQTGANGNIQVTGTRTFNTGIDITIGGSAVATGNAFPATGIDTLMLNHTTAGGIVLTAATSINTLQITNTGRLITESLTKLTVLGTNAGSVTRSSTGYIDGPFSRSIAPGATGSFLFPVGKSTTAQAHAMELLNPVVTGPSCMVTAEVMNASAGGGNGTGITSLNTNRYWKISPTAGSSMTANVKIYENAMNGANKVAFATGTVPALTYQSVGGLVHNNISITGFSQVSFASTDTTFFVLGIGSSSGTFAGGTYNIGPGSLYNSLGEALANINNNSNLGGPVVLELQANYNPAVETYPIAFPQTIPTSATNTITIRPAAAVSSPVVFTGNTSGANIPLFDMNGAKFITIDGRPGGTGTDELIVIQQTGNNPAIRLINDAQNIIIRRVGLSANAVSATSGVVLFSTAAGSSSANGNSNDTIDFCTINGNNMSANAVYAFGSVSPADNKSCVLSNNKVFDFFTNGGAIAGVFIADGNTGWTIQQNYIYQTTAKTTTSNPALTGAVTVRGIYIANTAGNAFMIKNNMIGGNLSGITGSTFVFGDNTISAAANIIRGVEVSVGNTSASSVQGNSIGNITLFSTTNVDIFTGIYISAGLVNTGDDVANTIGSGTGSGSIMLTQIGTTTATGYGIRSATSGGNILNNIIGSVTLDIIRPTSTGSLLFHGINASGTHASPLLIANNTIGSLSSANSIYGSMSAVSGVGIIGIHLNGATGRAVTVKGNTIANMTNDNTTSSNNAYVLGIWATGASSVSTTITENTIRNLSNAARNSVATQNGALVGIATNASGAGSQVITENTIHTLVADNVSPISAAVTATGIYYSSTSSNATGNKIDRNFVHSFDGGGANTPIAQAGITIAGGSARVRVTNNMIRLGINAAGASVADTAMITGIQKTGGVLSAFFNSVYIGGSGVNNGAMSTYAFRRTNANADSVVNNLFVNERSGMAADGSHYAIGLTNNTSLVVNYNGYYANGTGGILGQLNTTAQPNLAAWKIAAGQDVYSFSASPSFVSPAGPAATVNLHISASVPTPVENTGMLIPSVTADFDGNDRSALTPVDIGAHAGNFIPKDVVPPTITYSLLDISASSAITRTLTATISDASGIIKTGVSSPRLYYKKMEAGGYVSTAGTMLSGDSLNGVWTFTINHNLIGGVFGGDSVYYFIAAQDVVTPGNMGSSPPGAEGLTTSAISTFPTVANSYQVREGIHGDFLIGATQSAPNYTDITSAIADIQAKILDGNINLLLQSDYSSATETFPILLPPFKTDSIGKTITIKPDAGVTKTITSNAIAVVKISGGDYYIIDGSNNGSNSRDLTLSNEGVVANSSVVWLASLSGTDGATNNIVKNCIVSGKDKNTTEVAIFSGGPTGAGAGSFNALFPNSNNIIRNNLVIKAKYGLWFKGVSAAVLDSNNRVEGNDFGTANAAEGFNEGIFVMQLQKNGVVSKNNIQGLSGNGVGTADIAGTSTILPVLYLRQSISCTLNGNKVFNINYAGTSRMHCIFVEAPAFNTVVNPSNNSITNNAVYNVRLSGTGSWLSGINGNGGYGDRFYFNSVYLTGVLNTTNNIITAFSNGTSSSAVATSTIEVKNNIFYVNGSSSGTAATFYAHYTPNATSYNGSVLNNNLLRSVAIAGANANTGYNGTARLTLADWKTATTQDASSISDDPNFASSTNLTPGLGSAVIGAGITAGGVVVDINDSVRSNPPSIGAYENGKDLTGPAIVYTLIPNTQSTANRVLTNFASITDISGVNVAANRPRIYYKKKSEANVFGTYPTDNVNSFDGWKYQDAANNATPFSFTIDYSLLTGAVVVGDIIQYFVSAQDLSATQNTSANPSKGFVASSVSSVAVAPDSPSFYHIIGAPMSGLYSVGAALSAPDYTTLSGALRDLELRGMSGSVTIQLTDASYAAPAETFPITLNRVEGASSSNTILIKPAPGISPVISAASSSAILKLNGAKYVTIDGSNTVNGTTKDLSIINTEVTANTAAIWISGNGSATGCSYDTIRNCMIQAGTNTQPSYGVFVGGNTITTATGDSNNYIAIVNNTISKVQTGIYAAAVNGNEGLYIANNTIGSTTAGSLIGQNFLTLIRANNAIVEGNDMFGISQTAAFDGVLIGAGVTNLHFNRNKIHDLANTNVNKLWAVNIASGASSNNTFSNNLIYNIISNATGTLATRICAGFAVSAGNGYKFYYNSVSLTGDRDLLATKPTVASACLFIASGLSSSLDIRNNIFSNTQTSATGGAKSYAIYCVSASGALNTINFNNYYTAGAQGVLAFINGDIATLPLLKVATGGDAYSVNVNPSFASASDLTVTSGSVPNAVESGATGIAAVQTDFNGDLRPNRTATSFGGNLAPDMGALEFDGAPSDVIPPVITFTPLGNGSSVVNRTFSISILDTGVTASGLLTFSGSAPRVYFRKKSDGNMFSLTNSATDSGWKWVEATNSTSPFSFTINYSLLLGGSASNNDTILYFITAQDLAVVSNIASSPSTGFSGTGVATVTGAPVTPYQYIIVTSAPMVGTYAVGSTTGAAYSTLTSAISDLTLRGVSGPVIFELTDNLYASSETFPIVLTSYTGSNATNTVTIKPASGINATITGNAGAAAVIKLLNASDYFIDGSGVNGSSLTIRSTNTVAGSAAIWMASTVSSGPGCNRISLKNLNIIGGSNTSTTFGIIAGADGATPTTTAGIDHDHITIENNTILKCYYGIYGNGTSATSAGGFDNWQINRNVIGPEIAGTDNIGHSGIWLANALNVSITNDTIRNIRSTVTPSGGIYLSSNINRAVVSGNTIRDIYSTGTSSGSTSVTGLYLGNNVVNSRVSANTIRGIANISTDGYGAKGLIINTANASSNDTIVNNFVSDVYCYVDINSIYWPVGINIEGASGGIRIYHNSVHLFGDHAGLNAGATASASLFVSANGGNLDIRNNIFRNSYHNSLSSTDKSYAFYSSANNTVYSELNYNNYNVSGSAGVLGYLSSDLTSLAAIRSATGKDLKSVSVDVSFVSPADLHLAAPSIGNYNLAGVAIPGITTDIDGDTRNTVPYMGADENTVSPLPVKLISFTATLKGAEVSLNWITASEINSNRFEVERATDLKNPQWTVTDNVKAAGNSHTIRRYLSSDNVAEIIREHDVIYYRLKAIDNDGSVSYSHVVSVNARNMAQSKASSVFPNPFTKELFVQHEAATSSTVKITMKDITGKILNTYFYEAEKGMNVFDLSDDTLKAGIYFISVEAENERGNVFKVVKQ